MNVINIKDCGVKSNSKHDDTIAMQRAMDNKTYIAPGNYTISKPIEIKK